MTTTDAPPATVCRCGHGPRIHSDEYGCDRTECGCTEFRPPGPLQTPTAVPAPPARPVVAPAPAAVTQPSQVAAAGEPLDERSAHLCPEPECPRTFDTAQGLLVHRARAHKQTVVEAVVSTTPVPSAPVVGPPAGLTPDADPDRFAVTFFDANATRIELDIRDVYRSLPGEPTRIAALWSFSPGVEAVCVELDEDEGRALAMALITAFGGVKP